MADQRVDARSLTLAVGVLLTVFFIGAAVHNGLYFKMTTGTGPNPAVARVLANVLASVMMLALLRVLRVGEMRRWLAAAPRIVAAALVASCLRSLVHRQFGLLADSWFGAWVAEYSVGTFFLVGAGMLGFAYSTGRRRLREQEREVSNQRVQREVALHALGDEEARVRQSVAEGLHGGLQQRLVLEIARIDMALADARDSGTELTEGWLLQNVRDELDRIREHEVRQVARLLFPERIDVALTPALRALLRRLPPAIGTSLTVSDGVREIDEAGRSRIPLPERLLAVRVVEEGITNALRHGGAGQVCVGLDVVEGRLRIVVTNDGLPIDTDVALSGSGMRQLADRVAIAGGELSVENVDESEADGVVASGVVVRCVLPIVLEDEVAASEGPRPRGAGEGLPGGDRDGTFVPTVPEAEPPDRVIHGEQ